MNKEKKIILGISAFYHDSAATLLIDGKIVAAAHEERFTRKKHDASFPAEAIRFVLGEYGLGISELSAIAFYDKPYVKFERLLETYYTFAPRGIKSFLVVIPIWIKEKLFTKRNIKKGLLLIDSTIRKYPPIFFSEHHLSHAASAFYPSPFEKAAILTVDGVGEWVTTMIGLGEGKSITVLKELHFPHSLGLLYSAFTYYCGFKVNSGEYKLMGLAPYGLKGNRVNEYKKKIMENLIDLKEDGSLLLNQGYFAFTTELRMCRDREWEKLFGIPPRNTEDEITQEYMDLALAIQEITEDTIVLLAKTAREITGATKLVMAGGVALNCVANSKIVEAGIFDEVWVQPAAGDAGGALGAAYATHYLLGDDARAVVSGEDSMRGSYLGPWYGDPEIERVCNKYNAIYEKCENEDILIKKTAELISGGKVVGWFQGRMEWGPRALGNRSILGDPRNPEMQKKLNLKIKLREGFRPFAPSVLAEDREEYFEMKQTSPYMLFVAPVKKERRKKLSSSNNMYERLYSLRSDIPAVTHLDYSARIQTVSRKDNERYWKLINAFKKITGYGLMINTSFNVRGEPIVCTPDDAYRCFMATDMDVLVMGDYVFEKSKQVLDGALFKQNYELD